MRPANTDEIKKSLRDVEPNKLKWASRLSEAKSLSINTDQVLITSDQTVVLHDQIIGKSKTFEKAVEQLKKAHDKRYDHHRAVAVPAEGVGENANSNADDSDDSDV